MSDLTVFQDVIAAHKKLRALRIVPHVYATYRQWIDCVLDHLKRQGCLVELLTFNPHLEPSEERDYWPWQDDKFYHTFKSGSNSGMRQITTALSNKDARKMYPEWELMFRGFADIPRL